MPEKDATPFEEIEGLALMDSDEVELRKLNILKERNMDKYRDEVTTLYMQRMYGKKIMRVADRGKAIGKKRPGSHGEDRHK